MLFRMYERHFFPDGLPNGHLLHSPVEAGICLLFQVNERPFLFCQRLPRFTSDLFINLENALWLLWVFVLGIFLVWVVSEHSRIIAVA